MCIWWPTTVYTKGRLRKSLQTIRAVWQHDAHSFFFFGVEIGLSSVFKHCLTVMTSWIFCSSDWMNTCNHSWLALTWWTPDGTSEDHFGFSRRWVMRGRGGLRREGCCLSPVILSGERKTNEGARVHPFKSALNAESSLEKQILCARITLWWCRMCEHQGGHWHHCPPRRSHQLLCLPSQKHAVHIFPSTAGTHKIQFLRKSSKT